MAGDGIGMPPIEDGVVAEVTLVDVELVTEIVGKPLLVAEIGVVGRRGHGKRLDGLLDHPADGVHGERIGMREVECPTAGLGRLHGVGDHLGHPVDRHEVLVVGKIHAEQG